MRRDTLVQLLAIGCLIFFMIGSGFITTQLAVSAGRNRLVYADAARDGDPPEVALGIAMGAFRGLFVNWLWIRANDLKEQGKYYEAVDLAKTITRLQPRFPRVWSFHAWNLAYNISVATNTPQERWNWVKSGIELIRRDGIRANPGEVVLYRELAWIHMHKIQAYMDDSHQFYKRQFAYDWTIILGPPPKIPLDITDPAKRREYFADYWLKPIADAPDSLEALYAKLPAAKTLAERIEKTTGYKLDRSLLEEVEIIKSVGRSAEGLGLDAPVLPPGPLTDIMTDPANRNAGPLLIRTIRKKILTDEMNMDPDRMIRYTLLYGPLDWRHASAHAIYWSACGSEEAALRVNQLNSKDLDLVNNDRLTIQALQDMFRSGTIYFDILNPSFYQQVPNLDYVDSYGLAIREAAKRSFFENKEGAQTRAYTVYQAGYENFLRDAVRFLYRRGDVDTASKYYEELRTNPYRNVNNRWANEETNLPLAEFVVHEIKKDDRVTSPVVATQEIQGAFVSAFTDGLLSHNQKVFDENMSYAKKIHEVYQERQGYKTFMAGGASGAGRLGFPPFDIMAARALAVMATEAGLLHGSIMYRAAPEQLRGKAYVFLENSPLKAQLDAVAEGSRGFDFWYPPPAESDLAGYRRQVDTFFQSWGKDTGNVQEK